MTTGELLRLAASRLAEAGCDAPRLEAELLLMHAWQVDRTALIIRSHDDIPGEIQNRFGDLLDRREQREPLAYIIGEKEFWSRPFRVTADVLIPRPETEHLIEAVMELFPEQQGAYRFCDIGTGSGCIAVTLACEYANARVVATDISESALAIAAANAERLGASDRIVFRHGDLMAAMQEHDGPFDAIVSNPPYVSKDEMDGLEKELAHEPRGALTDEADGLQLLAAILNEGVKRLKKNGLIIVETGPCGLPAAPSGLSLEKEIFDLAGKLRGGIYQAR